MSTTALTSTEVTTTKFALNANDLYTYPVDKTIKALATCAKQCNIITIKAPNSSAGQFTFDVRGLSRESFLSNVLKVHYRIPFTIMLASPATNDITADNFIKEVFNDNTDICLSQYGIVQGEEYSQLTLGTTPLNGVTNVATLSNITSPYYDSDSVNEYIQASQPDRFQSFENYTSSGDLAFKFWNQHDRQAWTTISPENEQNIFGSKYQSGYSSRTPQWEFKEAIGKNGVKVICSFWSYNSFSLGAAPNDEATVSGLETFSLVTRLSNDLGSKVFNLKKTGGALRYASIMQDTSNVVDTEATLEYRVYTPPDFMKKTMIGPDGRMKPYSVSLPRIHLHELSSYPVAPGASTSFSQGAISISGIPQSLYIGLLKERPGGLVGNQTPVNFGLMTNLTVHINGAPTTFPTLSSLDYLTNANGYDELDPLGKLLKGFPVKLDVGKDLSITQDAVVGAMGSYNLQVTGTFRNQGTDAGNYRLFIVTVFDSTLDYDGMSFSSSSGFEVPPQLLNSQYFLSDLYAQNQKKINVLGAGRFGNAMKWIGKQIKNIAKTAWDNRDGIADAIGTATSLAKKFAGKQASHNVSGGMRDGTTTFGAGSVKSNVFK